MMVLVDACHVWMPSCCGHKHVLRREWLDSFHVVVIKNKNSDCSGKFGIHVVCVDIVHTQVTMVLSHEGSKSSVHLCSVGSNHYRSLILLSYPGYTRLVYTVQPLGASGLHSGLLTVLYVWVIINGLHGIRRTSRLENWVGRCGLRCNVICALSAVMPIWCHYGHWTCVAPGPQVVAYSWQYSVDK